jgi:hypothetical protein
MLARGVNVVRCSSPSAWRFSLSCNPDLTVDVAQGMRASGAPCIVRSARQRKLPFMGADAEVDESFFDLVVDAPEHQHELFGVPALRSSPPITRSAYTQPRW